MPRLGHGEKEDDSASQGRKGTDTEWRDGGKMAANKGGVARSTRRLLWNRRVGETGDFGTDGMMEPTVLAGK
jgi:hypothetical protein